MPSEPRRATEHRDDLMDVPEDASIVRDDALERLLKLLLAFLLVKLHEDLLQACCQHPTVPDRNWALT